MPKYEIKFKQPCHILCFSLRPLRVIPGFLPSTVTLPIHGFRPTGRVYNTRSNSILSNLSAVKSFYLLTLKPTDV